ncbi:MAG: hypothetical protein KGR16_01350 [Verrucomicrobia bacterium]|nr:hypothetical protein [Verrucomicrobiota bacterium]MDE3048079.1 hypothetical protein [Verrucomicrobiota bacterium]
MATKKEIKKHLEIALKEIGEIKPWFDKDVSAWVFEHRAYPVEYAGESKEEVIENYPKYLYEFIQHRLDHRLHPLMEKKTKGRGGKRPGAGRPKGTKKAPTKVVRLPTDIANWVEKPSSYSQVRQWIAKGR